MRTEPSRLSRRLPALALIGIAAVVVVYGLTLRWTHAEQLRDRAAEQGIPTVALVSPAPVTNAGLELPARIEAWSRAPIYARVSGYLKRWTADIGTPVKTGQLLAELETPDLDQQLAQARAELASSRSEAELASTTAKRWQSLLNSDSVSRQEVEERSADSDTKRAQVNALQANVDRVQALQQYRRLVAPFDGIVTARNTDVGSLINVGMTPGSELFVVSDTRRLRVYVNVPQRQVAAIHAGDQAQLNVPERPGQTFTATVQSLSQAIDARSGSMLVQLTVDNKNGELLPGGYASVRFATTASAGALGLPPSALIVDKNGVRIAVVDKDGRVRFKNVSVARDFGNVVALSSGLDSGDKVISNPPDGLEDGDRVRIQTAQEASS